MAANDWNEGNSKKGVGTTCCLSRGSFKFGASPKMGPLLVAYVLLRSPYSCRRYPVEGGGQNSLSPCERQKSEEGVVNGQLSIA